MNFQSKSILSILLVLGSVGLGYFGVWPQWKTYSTAQAQLKNAQEEQQKLQVAQTQLNDFLNEYSQHSADADRVNSALPLSRNEIYNVLNNLDVLSQQSGVGLAGLTTHDLPETDQLGAQTNSIIPMDVDITVTGTYFAFKEFLSSLEKNLRIIDVYSMSVTANNDKTGNNYVLVFKTYYQK